MTKYDVEMAKRAGGRPRAADPATLLTARVNCAVTGRQKDTIEETAARLHVSTSMLIRLWIDAGCPLKGE